MQVEASFLLVPFDLHKCLSDLKVSNQNYFFVLVFLVVFSCMSLIWVVLDLGLLILEWPKEKCRLA